MLLLLYKCLIYQCPVITVAVVYQQCPSKNEENRVSVQYADWSHV